MRVEPRDCFLASWPRSGNTWLRHIIYFYTTGISDLDMTTLDSFCPIIDGIELKQHLLKMEDQEHRFIKSHELCAPYLLNGRIVYLVRDGRDATWSYYKYRLGRRHHSPSDFDSFLRLCLNDKIRYYSWHRNVSSWLKYKHNPSMLLLRFEDMRADPKGTFVSILDHLDIPIDLERVDASVALATPDRVNSTFRSEVGARLGRGDGVGHGGLVERWREVYTREQLDMFEDKAGDVLRSLGYRTSMDVV